MKRHALPRTVDGFIDVPAIPRTGMANAFPGMIPEVYDIRDEDFPQLDAHGRVYLDSGATSQEPNSVKERMHRYKMHEIRGSNHSENSVEARHAQEGYESARANVQEFFGAHDYSVAFTSGTTGSSNAVASRFPFTRGDLLLLTEMEHNSQIMTARNAARRAHAHVEYVPVDHEGYLDLDALDAILAKQGDGRVLMNLVHASNVTGIVNPVREIREIIDRRVGDRGFMYLDVAQSAGHIPIDLDDLGPDFAALSAHKVYGPQGVGALFVSERGNAILNDHVTGGSTILLIGKSFELYRDPPERFEPGTRNIEGAIEFGMTVDYLRKIGMDRIEAHDKALGEYLTGELGRIEGVETYGPGLPFHDRVPVVTFNIGPFGLKNYEQAASALDRREVSVRDGCFCANIYFRTLIGSDIDVPDTLGKAAKAKKLREIRQSLIDGSLVPVGAIRASIAFYNTPEDIYKAVMAIRDAAKAL